jgi:hypothetical protein
VAAYRRDTTFEAALLFASISLSNVAEYRQADSLLERLSGKRSELTSYQQAWLDYRRALMAGQRRAALSAVRALDSLDPGSKATYNHAVEALENGYVEEAVATLRSLSPDHGAMRGWVPYFEVLGTAYHLLGRFSDELAVGEDARRRFPDRRYALLPSVRALAALGQIPALEDLLSRAMALPTAQSGTTMPELFLEAADELGAHGDRGEAAKLYARALQSNARLNVGNEDQQFLLLKAHAERGLDQWSEVERTSRALMRYDSSAAEYLGLLGTAVAHLGRRQEAEKIIATLASDRRPYQFGVPQLAQARIATALGDNTAAIAYLTQSFAAGRQFDLWIHRDSDFDPLRPLQQFQKLVALRR